MLTWIFAFFIPCVCTGMGTPKLSLENTVFVAFRGENLTIKGDLTKPANQSGDKLTCTDPFNKKIYSRTFDLPAAKAKKYNLTLVIKNLNSSGEYYCNYKEDKVYWFLRIRDKGYRDMEKISDKAKFITVAVFTGILLLFSVVGSVYVFRGHWLITKCGETGKKRKQNNEEREERAVEEDVKTVPSPSIYASLEPRPASIYDVLDHSAANIEPDQEQAKPEKKEPHKTKVQTAQHQDEGMLESVYENF
uniref:NFAT activation molecule 1 isoform X1 n=1 Tax=Monopterus albus TaxID=43700 RepID=UPI0009B3C8BC|nr:uncharacterized protein LOC109958475 isoform X1 [Monopterus albus]